MCNVNYISQEEITDVVSKLYGTLKSSSVCYVENRINIANAQVCKELIEVGDGVRESQLTATECSQLIEYYAQYRLIQVHIALSTQVVQRIGLKRLYSFFINSHFLM